MIDSKTLIDAEKLVLSQAMNGTQAFTDLRDKGISRQTFSLPAHQHIWSALETIAKTGGTVDALTVIAHLETQGQLDAGNREEAWEGCLQYVLDNTSAVRSWMGSDSHPATEFILRDHYFNSGSRNTGKILQRALNDYGASLTVDGIPGKQTRQTLQAVLARSGEAEFIASLNEQRKAFYRSCKQFPVFGRGWLRRCDDAFSFARSIV